MNFEINLAFFIILKGFQWSKQNNFFEVSVWLPCCNLVQFKGKLMKQNWPDLGLFGPNVPPLSHFFESFTSTSSYTLFQAINLCYLKENKWSKLEKMANKPVTLGLILARFGSDLFPKKVFVGFNSTRCYALLQAFIVIIACNFKENQ